MSFFDGNPSKKDKKKVFSALEGEDIGWAKLTCLSLNPFWTGAGEVLPSNRIAGSIFSLLTILVLLWYHQAHETWPTGSRSCWTCLKGEDYQRYQFSSE